MILEGIVTTLSVRGDVNIAPMGPDVEPAMDRFVLKPFRTSQTYRNLRERRAGVFHVTDDVLLLAQAALGVIEPWPALLPAEQIDGRILHDCCRFYEFEVASLDDSQERCRVEAAVVRSGHVRDFFGFNRAKHAVVEAAILATRTAFLPLEEIEAEFSKLAVMIGKTGGVQEQKAFDLLRGHVHRTREERKNEKEDVTPEA